VRPDDVVAGMRSCGPLVIGGPPLATRTEQGTYDPDSRTVGEPLAPASDD
jgi:hypothetical protein